jgi:predicted glycoside hydrolase/deacetylase ChbG (UPF0249 family)
MRRFVPSIAIVIGAIPLRLFAAEGAPVPGAPSGEIRLIVRADDMGSSHAANLACVKAWKEGIVRSVEVLVPAPWFPEAVKMIAENPGMDIGVHLDLTSEWDTCRWGPITRSPSLMDEDGRFYPMNRQRSDFPPRTGFLDAKPKPEEVEAELRAQIELAKKRIGSISHMSAHMGTPVCTPEFRAIAEKLSKEYGLPVDVPPGVRFARGFPQKLSPEEKEAWFAKMLEGLEPGLWLFIEHPGMDGPEMGAMGHIGYRDVALDREGVTRAFTSGKVKEVVAKRGIRLLSYAEAAREAKAAQPPADRPSGDDKTSAAPGRRAAPPNPKLVKLPFAFGGERMENTPVAFKDRPLLVENVRPGGIHAKGKDAYLSITDLVTGQSVARFGEGHSFVSAFVEGAELNVFATAFESFGAVMDTKRIDRLVTTDLKTWKQETVLNRDGEEQFFNTSVCRDDQGYIMAYESDVPVRWCFRFARSKDLSRWEKIRGLEFADVGGKTAAANPTIRYIPPYWYLIYGVWCFQEPHASYYRYRLPETKYVTLVARSKDLVSWDLSPTTGPMLDPVPGEGINNTDADLFEFEGNTYIFYATGDQATWGTIRAAMYGGPMRECLESFFPGGAPLLRFDAKERKYLAPE